MWSAIARRPHPNAFTERRPRSVDEVPRRLRRPVAAGFSVLAERIAGNILMIARTDIGPRCRPSAELHPPPGIPADPPFLPDFARLNPTHTDLRAAPMRLRYLLHVALPVVLGAAIYVLFRSPRLRVFDWLHAAGLGDAVPAARAWAQPAAEHLPPWLLYSAPDGLWVYGLTACLALVWRGAPGRARRAWLCAGILLGAGGELGQLAGPVPGVFDPADLLLCVLAGGAAIVMNPVWSNE